VIAGHDPKDATSSSAPVPDYAAESDRPVNESGKAGEPGKAGLRIGVPAEYFADGLDPEVRAAIEKGIESLKAAGCTVKPVSLPHTRYAIPTYYLVATAEASANLARFDGVRYGYRSPDSETLSAMYRNSREEGFGAEVKRRILLGTYALSAGYYDAYYLKAQQVRRLLAEEFLRAFAEVDAIVTPTAPTPAFKLGEKTGDPLAMYLADIYTVTASLAGICGVTVPCGTTQAGLPVGMQVLAAHLHEGTAFRVARAVEAAQQ
jgi:aspartyl-tRNA(Asn)/glutamyl-tRNA(Gln) amidotransferase subunit A